MKPTKNKDTASPPHWFWTMSEGRSVFEFSALCAALPLLPLFKGGDGHPVLVFPGLFGTDRSTFPLRAVLRQIGYNTYGWGQGQNRNFSEGLERNLLALLDKTHARHRRKVSMIGWSLGGTFAREIAKAKPEKVRCVITLGSPISSNRANVSSFTQTLSDRVSGQTDRLHAERMATLNVPPPVPTTTIYSKTDGVVGWRGAHQHSHKGFAEAENIEVPASHSGMGFNPLVISIIADRLRQQESRWLPFDASGLRRFFLKVS